MSITLLGTSIIGSARGGKSGATARSTNAATGEALEPPFHAATADEVARAAEMARDAFVGYSRMDGKKRGAFLREIANRIEGLGEVLSTRACVESGLPLPRIQGETGRTCGQLRLFAGIIEDGSWVDARIDHADPNRQPIPKVDLRSFLRPVGPVAVFCASNFPLAFSVAGGDTAAALAAGCSVVVKAHSSHQGTAELVGNVVRDAAAASGMPEGVFSLLFGSGRETGTQLITHPAICAAGFTGSRAGGKALMDLAAARPVPIPVFAEMSSINPVFVLASALKERAAALATGFHGSLTMGVGQFCTNPGLVILDRNGPVDAFKEQLAKLVPGTAPGVMLNASICQAYHKGVAALKINPNVKRLSAAPEAADRGTAAVFETTAQAFLSDHSLQAEVFGPCTLLVLASGPAEMLKIAEHLEGQLTASIHASVDDLAGQTDLIAALERKAGRLVFNGFPTGVEVCHAMIHGGPFPATADGRSTSVGAQAIGRFVRPVCYQSYPDAVLPPELQDANPLGLWRIVDGKRQQP